MISTSEARKFFPYLNTGKIYFNHAALGPMSSLVTRQLENYIKQRSLTHVDNYMEYLPVYISAKRRLARLLGTSEDRIAWVENSSTGLNILAQGLPWQKGDEIILNDLEFPSNVYPFLNLRPLGVDLKFAKSIDGRIPVEAIERLITKKTRLISISLVQFLSGYRADIAKISRLAKANDILLSLDTIQASGAIDVNLEKLRCDFATGGTQKWLMGMMGLAYMFIGPALKDRLTQKFAGWLSVENEWDLLNYDLKLKDSAESFQIGTQSCIAMAALDSSLELFESVGIQNIEKANLKNLRYFTEKLSSAGFRPMQTDWEDSELASIISFPHQRAIETFENLAKKNIICSQREGWLRFSPHYYNTEEEIDRVVSALGD